MRTTTMAARIAALQDMTLADLRETYHEVFGEETRSRHKDFLRKRIAWRLQANEEGDLSERAKRRAAEIATPTLSALEWAARPKLVEMAAESVSRMDALVRKPRKPNSRLRAAVKRHAAE